MGVYDVASNSLQSRGNFLVRPERLGGNSDPGDGGGGMEGDCAVGPSNSESSTTSPDEGSVYICLAGNCLSGH